MVGDISYTLTMNPDFAIVAQTFEVLLASSNTGLGRAHQDVKDVGRLCTHLV